MANELRRYANWVGGLVEDNPLAAAATTLTSAGLAAMPAVGSTEHMLIHFDPDGLTGAPFTKRVTAHTAAATTATIEAAAVIGTARAIDRDVPWVHSLVADDIDRHVVVSKAADETVTSSTTLQDDDALTFPVLSGQRWTGEIRMVYSGAATGDIKFALGTPAGSTGVRSVIALGLNAGADEDNMRTAGANNIDGTTDTGNGFGCVDTAARSLAIMFFNVLCGADGTIRLRWAQATSDGTATTVRAGSSLVADRVFI